ncbi:MAG: penicillin-binding protein 2 [Patescibacteria group bacterium]|nr:penicillin-binding protein 2 [Patescibacteria group bacterium]
MSSKWRLLFLNLIFSFIGFLLLTRLFYWQILASEKLVNLASLQQQITIEVSAKRGEILTSDGSFLVANQPAYFSYIKRNQTKTLPKNLAETLSPIVFSSIVTTATPSSLLNSEDKKILIKKAEKILNERFSDQKLQWIPIARKISLEKRNQLEALSYQNIFFEEEQSRLYPEASMSAHLLGFVGSNEQGGDQGFYGLEGFYQRELAGRPGIIKQEKDAFNQPIVMGDYLTQNKKDGRQLQLHLNKSLQYIIENKLAKAITQFKAKSGSISVMDPHTGAIIAMASLPAYDPQEFSIFNPKLFLNPIISNAFEPGSIFKVLVMAAGLDAGVIEKNTRCDICDKPLKIDKYTIKTWDDKYWPDSNMTDVLVHSDNVGMVFIGQKLGIAKFYDYFDKFGFNQKTNIDLQDEITSVARKKSKWSYVDLATASFGQGFLSTGVQLLQAVSVIANGGNLVEPHVVKKVISPTKEIIIPTKIKHRVISKETADMVTDMMVASAKEGEAKWTNVKGYQIAGKTGTAQIAYQGKYQEEKTNASFIGFAPAKNPKFVMLVTIREPSTSQWASETAAPLWFSIAQDLLNHFNILPE